MRWVLLGLIGFVLSACAADETLTGYAPHGTYLLTHVNGSDAHYTATLTLGPDGAFSGRAPCNTYSGTIQVPYPWIETGPIASTRMACPDLTSESEFFAALQSMTLAETSGRVLILSNDDALSLTFEHQP